MRLAICAAGLAAALLAATTIHAGPPRAPRPTLGQFIGLSSSTSACATQCCATPACEPKCCPTPICEPKCCPPPVCEPKCAPTLVCEPKPCPAPVCEPKCCPEPICGPKCGCETSCAPCCPTSCQPCCTKQYPLERLLSRVDRALFGKNKCCEQRDPCGYDLWPCVGQCCKPAAASAYPQSPIYLNPEQLRPEKEAPTDPFIDDPEQPPRPPMSPDNVTVRGARVQRAVQRYPR